MRPLTRAESVIDKIGFPFDGRLLVCEHGTTIVASLVDVNGNAVSNPVPVSNGKCDYQAFLPNVDVDVYLQRLVDEDYPELPQSWQNVDEYTDTFNTVSFSVDSDAVTSVNTIEDLRSLDPATTAEQSGNHYAQLLGYYAQGDKPSVFYVFDSESTATDNGGDIIHCDGVTGNWIMVVSEKEIDARHFGCFPADSPANAYDSFTTMSFAASRAAALEKTLYLPATPTICYYCVDTLSLHDVKADASTIVVCSTGYNASLFECDVKAFSTQDFEGTITLTAKEIKTSQDLTSGNGTVVLRPLSKLIVDENYSGALNVANVEVVMPYNVKHLTSDESVFNHCRLYEAMFSSLIVAATCAANSTNCFTSINDWSTADNYFTIALALGQKNIDLNGGTIQSVSILGQGNFKLSNAIVSGRIDCPNISLDNVQVGSSVRCTTIAAKGCSFSDVSFVWADEINADNCTFGYNVRADKNAVFTACLFDNGSNIDIYADDNVYSLVVDRCVFIDNGVITLKATGSETEKSLSVNLQVTNNVGCDFACEPAAGKFRDLYHKYVYENNGDGYTSGHFSARVVGDVAVEDCLKLFAFGMHNVNRLLLIHDALDNSKIYTYQDFATLTGSNGKTTLSLEFVADHANYGDGIAYADVL